MFSSCIYVVLQKESKFPRKAELAHAQKNTEGKQGILDSWRGISPVGQPRDKPLADFGSAAAAVDTSPGAVQEQASPKASAGQHGKGVRVWLGIAIHAEQWRRSTPALPENRVTSAQPLSSNLE
ncbi:hypothetical protein PVAP13_3NG079702 [Panicum virgatum]|uniref:Uncharacterized protein n=1 Tax=Panicum virgatum TaxID=38727 RepID=A0A8T0U9S8_PANVG|nr:hypothetical protein PVAP13_3NG079702 [Panicum virgatum]